jgi:hypothetical protein
MHYDNLLIGLLRRYNQQKVSNKQIMVMFKVFFKIFHIYIVIALFLILPVEILASIVDLLRLAYKLIFQRFASISSWESHAYSACILTLGTIVYFSFYRKLFKLEFPHVKKLTFFSLKNAKRCFLAGLFSSPLIFWFCIEVGKSAWALPLYLVVKAIS